MENKSKKNKLWVRALAWVLAGLMVVSVAYFTIFMISESFHDHEETEQT